MGPGARNADIEQLLLICEVIDLHENDSAAVEALEAANRIDRDDTGKDRRRTAAVGTDSLESLGVYLAIVMLLFAGRAFRDSAERRVLVWVLPSRWEGRCIRRTSRTSGSSSFGRSVSGAWRRLRSLQGSAP